MSLDVTWCHLMPLEATWCHLMQLDATWCYLIQLGAAWCSLMLTCYMVLVFLHVKVTSLLVLRLGGWVWTLKLMLSQPKLKLELELGLSLAKSTLTHQSALCACWRGKPASRQKSHVPVFVADIWKSEQNVRLANKLDIAHEYLSLSEYIVLGCTLYYTDFLV